MMKMLFVLQVTIISLFLIPGQLFAQQKDGNKGHIELEVDPLAYAFKGYSFHAGYQLNRFRYDIGVFGLEVPEMFTSNDDFIERTNGVGIKVDYVGKNPGGWFVGAEADYGWTKATLKENRRQQKGESFAVGLRGGYRFMFGRSARQNKGFYIAPWIGIDKLIYTKDIRFEERKYKQDGFRFFPTVHLGWRF